MHMMRPAGTVGPRVSLTPEEKASIGRDHRPRPAMSNTNVSGSSKPKAQGNIKIKTEKMSPMSVTMQPACDPEPIMIDVNNVEIHETAKSIEETDSTIPEPLHSVPEDKEDTNDQDEDLPQKADSTDEAATFKNLQPVQAQEEGERTTEEDAPEHQPVFKQWEASPDLIIEGATAPVKTCPHQYFDVTQIMDDRGTVGVDKWYKVRWDGDWEDSWEPEENLNCPELVQDYQLKENLTPLGTTQGIEPVSSRTRSKYQKNDAKEHSTARSLRWDPGEEGSMDTALSDDYSEPEILDFGDTDTEPMGEEEHKLSLHQEGDVNLSSHGWKIILKATGELNAQAAPRMADLNELDDLRAAGAKDVLHVSAPTSAKSKTIISLLKKQGFQQEHLWLHHPKRELTAFLYTTDILIQGSKDARNWIQRLLPKTVQHRKALATGSTLMLQLTGPTPLPDEDGIS